MKKYKDYHKEYLDRDEYYYFSPSSTLRKKSTYNFIRNMMDELSDELIIDILLDVGDYYLVRDIVSYYKPELDLISVVDNFPDNKVAGNKCQKFWDAKFIKHTKENKRKLEQKFIKYVLNNQLEFEI